MTTKYDESGAIISETGVVKKVIHYDNGNYIYVVTPDGRASEIKMSSAYLERFSVNDKVVFRNSYNNFEIIEKI
ncbi:MULTISPECIES: hypothetical protein [unclassified Pseudomonas]|uniref:hypothetical protein n=1 Tax=unclassified Pseudomonas TaxID=196821 RepID=UPI001A9ECADD|nr:MULTISPECIES: hypothetical protein [unclassified Pseudomonas]